jgi:hypothetical protein
VQKSTTTGCPCNATSTGITLECLFP